MCEPALIILNHNPTILSIGYRCRMVLNLCTKLYIKTQNLRVIVLRAIIPARGYPSVLRLRIVYHTPTILSRGNFHCRNMTNRLQAKTSKFELFRPKLNKTNKEGDCSYKITKNKDITNGTAGQALIKAAGSVYDVSVDGNARVLVKNPKYEKQHPCQPLASKIIYHIRPILSRENSRCSCPS